MKTQTNKQHYVNLIKNVARLGAGSALVLMQVAILSGATLLAKRSKRRATQSSVKALPYEK